jgi:endonuclease/exonuclease/phosphatase family metal-dependent hydrolase
VVRSAERTATTANVTVPDRAQAVHASDHYGMRAVVTVAP